MTWTTELLAKLAETRCGSGSFAHRFKVPRLSSSGRVPVLAGATAQEAARGPPSLRNAISSWAHHAPVIDPSGTVSFFRSPSQRVLSAYHFNWGLHLVGSGDYYRETINAKDRSLNKFRVGDWTSFIHRRKGNITEAEFAASPGVWGCAAKMLSGCGCATRPLAPSRRPVLSLGPLSERRDQLPLRVACEHETPTLDTAFARRAASKVDHLAFAGLTDLYNSSICLFHHFFPTAATSKGPEQSEFTHFNAGSKRTLGKGKTTAYSLLASSPPPSYNSRHGGRGSGVLGYDETVLGDFVDFLDEAVFAAVLRRFERDLDRVLFAVRELQGPGKALEKALVK